MLSWRGIYNSPALFMPLQMMKIHTEKELITGIRHHDSAILEFVYGTYFPIIEGYVIHHYGNRDQAKDVFQEAMIIVYNKIKSNKLELSCKFGTYLYAICKNIWMQERKKYQLHAEKLRQQPLVVNDPGPADDPLLQNQLNELFNKHFNELSKDCQKILSMYFNNFTVEDIRVSNELQGSASCSRQKVQVQKKPHKKDCE